MMITENMRVCEVLHINEGLEKIQENHGLPCLECPGAEQETLKEAAEAHGVDIKSLLDDLNKSPL